MIAWSPSVPVYLHREPVDFRKAINGLAVIVADSMALDVYSEALFVFCNKKRTQLKVLYWDNTGFALWQKRLEKDKFRWPRKAVNETLVIDHEQWQWLLRGVDFTQIKAHETLYFKHVC
ncbi:MAG: IS66 family insertion sequence hypothetical protein [Gammaproteobacteria bacterium]|nr:MAG: IS66 family insertion sequence hypothetical protein [Gammaproteobacteria bacterium]